MMPNRSMAVLIGLLVTTAPAATAQQPIAPTDSTHAQLGTTLRAFYFNLAHRDWEALAADILSAKVLASRPAPEVLVAAATLPATSGDAPECGPDAGALVDRAKIMLDGEWAEVSVPRCDAGAGAADEFRLIRFEARWRIVYIDLFRESDAVQLAR